jgi:hypothetical protein
MEISGVFGLIIFVLDIYAILKIVQSSSSTGSKAVWIAVVLLLPLVGLIIWALFGPRDRS